MMIEDYKETVLNKLQKANDCEEVEQIINSSIEQFQEEDLYRFLVIIYLHILQNGLKKIVDLHTNYVDLNVDSVKLYNIRHALNYLKQMNENRSKVE